MNNIIKLVITFAAFATAYVLDKIFPLCPGMEILRADPATIAIVATVASVAASVGGTVYSAISSSEAADEAGEARAEAERQNAEMIETQKEQSRLAYEQKAADYQRRSKAALSTERALRGASGITMEGSPLLTYYENARIFEEDINRLRQGQEVTEKGLEQMKKLHQFYGQSALEQGEALSEQYAISGGLKTGSTLLTGAKDVWKTGRQVGSW